MSMTHESWPSHDRSQTETPKRKEPTCRLSPTCHSPKSAQSNDKAQWHLGITWTSYKSYNLNPYCTYSSYEYKGYPISINDLTFNKKNNHVFYLSKYKSNQKQNNNLNCFLNLSMPKKNIKLEKESQLLNNKNHLFYFVLE